jgi:anti-sigma regulatory factor (Ser/Thr protein kinase)
MKKRQQYIIDETLKEDNIWRDDLRPCFEELPKNVFSIWTYGILEMINNAIDHSEGSILNVLIEREDGQSAIIIQDNGIGIFKKIQQVFHLRYENEAILELSKGKLTTDSKRHSGEGIFFTSRSFDKFEILSGNNKFLHYKNHEKDFIFGSDYIQNKVEGTSIILCLNDNCTQTIDEVFRCYTTNMENGFIFDKTIVPVRLAAFGDEMLISRSQAKRLLMRFDRFRSVVLDFEGVQEIGQAFADEVFRVFCNEYPQIEIIAIHTNEQIEKMISRVTA